MKTNRGNAAAVITIIIALLLVGAYMFWRQPPIENETNSLSTTATSTAKSTAIINGKTVNLEVVNTPESRELGLGGRQSLPEDSAMLFVFDVPAAYEFWMKDMKFPLDMIWLDPTYKVIHIEKNVPPESYPDETFAPESEALYVIEANAGFSDKNNLKIGDVVEVRLIK